MASLDFLTSRYYAAENRSGRVVDDGGVAIRIVHTDTCAVTSVTVTTGTNIVLIDADGTTTSTFATDDTVGKVADRINASTNWKCKVLDALRADASTSKFIDGAISSATSAEGETVWDVKMDTSAIAQTKYRITYDRSVNAGKPSGSHRVTLKKIEYYSDMTAGANGIRIYKWDATSKAETQIWQAVSVDTTATSHDLGGGVTPGEGNDLIVVITGTVIDNASSYLQCQYLAE